MYKNGEGVDQDYKTAWILLNHVRKSCPVKDAKWRARFMLDEIKQELGIDKRVNRFSYPNWEELQRYIKTEK